MSCRMSRQELGRPQAVWMLKKCYVWQPHSLHTHQESCVQGHGADSAVVWGRDLDTECEALDFFPQPLCEDDPGGDQIPAIEGEIDVQDPDEQVWYELVYP